MTPSKEYLGAHLSDKDIRDYRLTKATIETEFPKEFELEMPPVKDQGAVGACVANSLATVVEYYNKEQEQMDDKVSPGYIYGNRGPLGFRGEGMYTRSALATLATEGAAFEKDFPHYGEVPEIIDLVEKEHDRVYPLAYPNRLTTYFSVRTTNEIKTALMKNGPVVISVKWYRKAKVLPNGVLERDTKQKHGYHCMVLYGWNKDGWKVQNSWGADWGINGRFIWPYSYHINEAFCAVDHFRFDIKLRQPFHCKSKFGKTLVRIWNKIENFFFRLFYNRKVK